MFGLAGDRLNDARIPVANVHAHQLAIEVEVPLAVGVVEIDSLGANDRDGRDLGLHCPVVERVALRPLDDLLGRQPLRLGFGAHFDLPFLHVSDTPNMLVFGSERMEIGMAVVPQQKDRLANDARTPDRTPRPAVA